MELMIKAPGNGPKTILYLAQPEILVTGLTALKESEMTAFKKVASASEIGTAPSYNRQFEPGSFLDFYLQVMALL